MLKIKDIAKKGEPFSINVFFIILTASQISICFSFSIVFNDFNCKCGLRIGEPCYSPELFVPPPPPPPASPLSKERGRKGAGGIN